MIGTRQHNWNRRGRCAAIRATSLAAAMLCAVASGSTNAVMRSVSEVSDAMENARVGIDFDVVARVTLPGRPRVLGFAAEDDSGGAWFGTNQSIADDCPTNAGVVVRLRGRTIPTGAGTGADCLHIDRVAVLPRPEPIPATATTIHSDGKLLNRLVRVRGTVHDIFRDDIDPRWIYVLVSCNDGIAYWSIYAADASVEKLDHLIGASVAADGIVSIFKNTRTTIGRILIAHDFSALNILGIPSENPYDAPTVNRETFPHPSKPAIVGRRRISGHVIAVWHGGDKMLVQSPDGDLHRVRLKRRPPPRYGEFVDVLGHPETDLYRINISRATWRPAKGPALPQAHVRRITAAEMFTDAWLAGSRGRELKNASLLGQAVRLRGTVRAMPAEGSDACRLYLETDSFMVPVEASGCPEAFDGVTAGCVLDVTGTYIAEADNLGTTLVFPQIREILIALRRPDDVVVVSRPPWLTPGRMLVLVGALVMAIFGTTAWCIALRRRAEQRGRELADEQLAHAMSELKVEERTRLAVELHDSLSQTLASVSIGIDAALGIAGDAAPELRRLLTLTARTLESCRTELRNCLWDLRSQALEEGDMGNAVRIALGQILTTGRLSVRFSVPRSRLSDRTAHAILRIVRELASNAARHGHATDIRVAGCLENGVLMFSVADNGCGFDPATAPGVRDGHFGLQGIKERIEFMDGTTKIESSPGRGTKVTISINVPPDEGAEGGSDGNE